jgi:hypothetical protein
MVGRMAGRLQEWLAAKSTFLAGIVKSEAIAAPASLKSSSLRPRADGASSRPVRKIVLIAEPAIVTRLRRGQLLVVVGWRRSSDGGCLAAA